MERLLFTQNSLFSKRVSVGVTGVSGPSLILPLFFLKRGPDKKKEGEKHRLSPIFLSFSLLFIK